MDKTKLDNLDAIIEVRLFTRFLEERRIDVDVSESESNEIADASIINTNITLTWIRLLPRNFPPILSLMTKVISSQLFEDIYIELIANMLINYLTQHSYNKESTHFDYSDGLTKSQLRKTQDYIHDNLESISILKLSKEIGMSQSHFSKLFNQSMGLSPYQYVIIKRVERAKKLLLCSENKSITDIAFEVGFCDQSHLTRHMKSILGVSPKKLRQSI